MKERAERQSEFERMVQFLDLAWKRKDQIVPCLVGPVGIGKTAAVRKHAENVGAKNVVTIIASQILPSEVSGITMPDSKTKSMEIYDHYRLSSLEDGDILFFDELLEADQCVLSACLTLIESRMMMSGRLLPDIQIIAATNPTANPANVRENIRQRFMFMEFAMDPKATADYIEEMVGFRPSDHLLRKLESSGPDFNILSPRSLTKLCEWMASAEDHDERNTIADIINKMFRNSLGSLIYESFIYESVDSEKQARNAMKEAFIANAEPDDLERFRVTIAGEGQMITEDRIDETFSETSMDELVDMLKDFGCWDSIAKQLSEMQVETMDVRDIDYEF